MRFENIGFDIDDTVANTRKILMDYFIKKYGQSSIKTKNSRISIKGVSEEDLSKKIMWLINENILNIEPTTGSKEVIKSIYSYNKKPIVFISKRPTYQEEKSLEWIKKTFKVPCVVKCIGRSNKSDYVKKYNLNYFVEDYLNVSEEIVKNSNCKVFLLKNNEINSDLNKSKISKNIILCENIDNILYKWFETTNKMKT